MIRLLLICVLMIVLVITANGHSDLTEICIYLVVGFFVLKFSDSFTADPKEKRGEVLKVFNNEKKETLIDKIKKEDSAFDKQQFLNFAKNIFVKYQKSINTNNMKYIQAFSTDEFLKKQEVLIESRHESKIDSKIRVEKDFLGIKMINLISYNKSDNKEIITVAIEYREKIHKYSFVTGKKIKDVGSGNKNSNQLVYVDFERVKKIDLENEIISTNCFQCGAPTQIISVGKCQYCGSIIQIEELEWKLKDIRNKEETWKKL